jgi:site-specific recombinase XerD
MIEITTPTVQEFYEWIKTNPLPGRHRRGSQKTIEGYASDLERFARWFQQSTGHKLSANTLTPDDIQDFLVWLQTVGGRKPSTVLRYFSAIRTYCLYLQRTDERILRDLSDGIRLPRQEKMTKRGLRRKERLAVERVFTIPWKNTEKARLRLIRDYALVETMMYVGLRIETLTKLKLEDLSLGERSGSIQVHQGKGNLDRVVGIPLKARQALAEWMKIRYALDCNHNFVFVQLRTGYQPLGNRSVQHIVKEVGRRAKLEFDLTPHILRHTAIRIWRKNTDDRTTATQMGHSIATMMKYDSIAEDDVLIAAEKI